MKKKLPDIFPMYLNKIENRYTSVYTNLEFENIINGNFTGNTFVKTGGVDDVYDCGFTSKKLFGNGEFIQYTVGDITKKVFFGFGRTGNDESYLNMEFAIYQKNDNTLQIYEYGFWVNELGGYDLGDKLRITIENDKVKYYQNGILIYTSVPSPILPLYMDATIKHSGGIIEKIICGIMQTGLNKNIFEPTYLSQNFILGE